ERGAILAGLEHLDERYLRAVGYSTKSKRGELPKMGLIGDIVGDDADAVALAADEVVRIANTRHGEGFVAVSAEARKRFWLDRARTAAIARHTNAFKINEDVVIPLNRMGEYTDGIERINVELSIKNKLQLVDQLRAYLASDHLPLAKSDDATGDGVDRDEIMGDRPLQARGLVDLVDKRWTFTLANLDAQLGEVRHQLESLGLDHLSAALDARLAIQPAARLFDAVQDHTVRVSW